MVARSASSQVTNTTSVPFLPASTDCSLGAASGGDCPKETAAIAMHNSRNSAHGTQHNPRVNSRNIPITLTDTALRNLSRWVNDQLMDEAVGLSAVNLKVTARAARIRACLRAEHLSCSAIPRSLVLAVLRSTGLLQTAQLNSG
jgi:hypothetical protein